MPVVEFLGVPGSGKSALAREVVRVVSGAMTIEAAVLETLRDQGQDRLTRPAARLLGTGWGRLWTAAYARSTDRFSALVRFAAAHPALLAAVLTAQQRRVDRDHGSDMVLDWILNLMARYELAAGDNRSNWLVIDEGFAQRGVALFSVGFDLSSDREFVDAYVAAVPPPDVVVAVETALEVCEERLDRRGWSDRIKHLDVDERRNILSNASVISTLLAARLEQSGSRLLYVNGTAPVSISVTQVADLLAR